YRLPSGQLSPNLVAASWKTGASDALIDGTSDRTIYDPSWIWCLAVGPGCPSNGPRPGPTTVGGPMTVEWWASCSGCAAGIGFQADWTIRLWADGVLRHEQRVTATPAAPGVASRLVATVSLPTIAAQQRLVLQVDPV